MVAGEIKGQCEAGECVMLFEQMTQQEPHQNNIYFLIQIQKQSRILEKFYLIICSSFFIVVGALVI